MAELERTIQSLHEELDVVQILLRLSGALAEVRTLRETLDTAVRTAAEALGADRCFAATWDKAGNRFTVGAQWGYHDERSYALEEAAERGDGLSLLRAVLNEAAPLFIPDARLDGRIDPDEARFRGLGAFIGIPLARGGMEFGALALEFSAPKTFGARDVAVARGIAAQVGVALANARRFSLLARLRTFGLRVGSKLRLHAVTREILAGATQLLGADAASLYFLDPTQLTLVSTRTHGESPGQQALSRVSLKEEPWSRLLEGRPVVVSHISGARDPKPRWDGTLVAAPVPGPRSPILGAVVVFFDGRRNLAPEDAGALSVLGVQAARAIENAHRYERERRVAKSLRAGLLKTELPQVAGCELGAVFDLAEAESEVGGDFVDVFDVSDGRLGIVVGDVSGKGVEAASQTAMVKYMLRAFALRNPGPSSVLFHLNNALVQGFEEDRFTTLVYAVYEPATRALSVAVAGHPTPLIYRTHPARPRSWRYTGAFLVPSRISSVRRRRGS